MPPINTTLTLPSLSPPPHTHTPGIAYGQTASGKTYTMVGPDGVLENMALAQGKLDGSKGIVPRACEEVLAYV